MIWQLRDCCCVPDEKLEEVTAVTAVAREPEKPPEKDFIEEAPKKEPEALGLESAKARDIGVVS